MKGRSAPLRGGIHPTLPQLSLRQPCIWRLHMREKKGFWLAALALGAAAVIAALILGILALVQGRLSLISGLVLGLILLGGAALLWLAICSLRTPAEVPAPKKQALRPARSRGAQRALSLFVLLPAAFLFLAAYARAQKVEPVPQSNVLVGIDYVRAKVVSVDENNFRNQQDVEDILIGKQTVTVEIRSGAHKGERYTVTNNLSYLYGTVVREGDSVTVSLAYEDGELYEVLLQDYDRSLMLGIVAALFLLITILVGGKIGAKSLLGLGLTILCIFSILIPLLLDGWPTLPAIFGLCAYVTVVEFVILDGVNKKTVCAILGTLSGVLLAAVFGQVASSLLRVDGFKMYTGNPEVEALLQIKQGQLPGTSLLIGDLLVGGILIAALGAVNDVAMSISSAMNELVTVNPKLTRKELFKSGMNIGRDMVGTMTNTLILALVGSSLVMIIYLTSLSPSFQQLMSTTYFSVEMVQALASSAGVILAVPLSVLFGMLLFGHSRKKAR